MTPSPNPSLADCDVVIVGGGISGLTLACGLQSSGLRILVVEAQQQQQATERCLRRASLREATPTPTRAYALSPMTSKIFRDLGLWGRQPQLDPISAQEATNGNDNVKHLASDH
ncbi:FAD-dependent oxidoreductase [uncultured Nostoc sp.]|uniref:FAD-dependent oxidoreductase n=1 Tax=uncultured Nostoc sp. TaxID=340711 RepID=UPI0035CB86AC